jgi:hypothetical protein
VKSRPSTWDAKRAEQQRKRREQKRGERGRTIWQPADLAFYRIAKMKRTP